MDEYTKKLEAALTKDDWQYIHTAAADRFHKGMSRPGEPPNSPAFKAQRDRIMFFLQRKAYN